MKYAILTLPLLLLCPLAHAESDDREPTTYTFEDDAVDGSLQRPEGEVLRSHKHNERTSLIRVRTQFIDRLLASVYAL